MTSRALSSLCSSIFFCFPMMAQQAGSPPNTQDHTRFCIRNGKDWMVQSYAPLVDTRNGTFIEQAVYSGGLLTHIVVKSYNQRYELLYDYHFNEGGRLIALHAYLQKWGSWLADADLNPNSDGSVPQPDIRYRLDTGGGIITDPKDGSDYTQVFRSVPVYWTEASVPCAALLQQAEKTNATQE